jgi:hypothetical protein
MPKMKPHVFERGDRVYIVAPVSPFTPGDHEIEEFAFAQQLKKQAPNELLMWLRGQYVEADNPNGNGQMWTAGELAIKHLTPMFMPVTVMHDPRTAVGLIADTALRTPEKDSVPRSRIETSLAIWQHRFPEIAEEVQVNYEAGELMQSMECVNPYYSCAECGQVFNKLPGGAERRNWCTHLAEKANGDGYTFGARILGNVVFTGTGLIFGTRGARGAYDEAHLDVFQDEVAEYHERAHRDTQTGRQARDRRRTSVDEVTLTKQEHAELVKRPTQDEFAAEKKRADDAEAAKAEAEKKVEETETKLKDAEKERDEAKKKVEEADEAARKADLGKERIGKLGSGFMEKLGEFTKQRVEEQAKEMSDEDWENRLKELEETTDTARDAKKDGDDEGGEGGSEGGEGKEEFSKEEVARSQAGAGGGGGGGNGTSPSVQERQSVVGGLISPPAEKAKTD